MNGKIYKLKDDAELVAIHEEMHKSEYDFQTLITKYPDLIPGDQINRENHRRWLLVGREIGNIDIFFLDQDGIPTIVEVKKSINNEIYREVAAQMLDYGSNLVFSQTVDTILSHVETNSPISLRDFLDNEISEDEFWEKVKTNLNEEKMRLIVAADDIPKDLLRIIEFLNKKTESIEVLAVEIKQYIDDMTGTKTLVPRLLGHPKERIIYFEPFLNEKTFYNNLDEIGVEFYQELIHFADNNNLNKKWTKKGFFLTVPLEDDEVKILQCSTDLYSSGQNVFSTSLNITNEVKGGEEIFRKFLDEILKLNDFTKTGNDFVFKIENNLDENEWKEFKRILLEIKEEIENNGLIDE